MIPIPDPGRLIPPRMPASQTPALKARFFCPHCRRPHLKADLRFQMAALDAELLAELEGGQGFLVTTGRRVPCPACGEPMDVAAMLAGRYDSAPWSWTRYVIGAALLAAFFLGGRELLGYLERQSWRQGTVSGQRMTRAEQLEQAVPPDLGEALLYYDLSLPKLHGAFTDHVRERSAALVSALVRERQGFFHQDTLLSEGHRYEQLLGPDGRAIGIMRIRNTFSNSEVHFFPGVVRDGETYFPDDSAGPTDATRILTLPRDDSDLDVPARARYVIPEGSLFAGTSLEFAAVPSNVEVGQPQTETILTGMAAIRIHVTGIVVRRPGS